MRGYDEDVYVRSSESPGQRSRAIPRLKIPVYLVRGKWFQFRPFGAVLPTHTPTDRVVGWTPVAASRLERERLSLTSLIDALFSLLQFRVRIRCNARVANFNACNHVLSSGWPGEKSQRLDRPGWTWLEIGAGSRGKSLRF